MTQPWSNPLRDKRDKRMPRIAGPCSVVIFGVTGDLARKKLMPAIYDLANRGLLPPSFALVGFARRDWADEDFGQVVYEAVKQHARTPFRQEVWDRLAEGFRFVQGTFDDEAGFARLAETLNKLDAERGTGGNHAFYLSIPPKAFPQVLEQLSRTGLAKKSDGHWSRVVIEKPFGHDLKSAEELNKIVNDVFPESSVFRIDHYLGKETVQNILALRFANEMFEPVWNAHYVDSVQITMAEDIGLGGRGGYYDGVGAARDVIQNHLLQLLALTAMEEPVNFSPAELQAEKIKVLSASTLAEPLDETTARGQYTAGWQGGERVVGLLEEEGFSTTSTTETFAAITVDVDTRRWAGVPFYLRTGKRLGRRVTEIALIFKRAPHLPFDATMTEELGQNALVIRVQPDEGITMRFGSKVPGNKMEVRDVSMDFSYGSAFAEESPEAYERLILDVLLGEPSLFPVNEEVELAWKILDPALEFWAAQDEAQGHPEPYESGGWGPDSAFEMLKRSGREWRRP
ncbi:glucose-6-phosphate dehydrogenase [Mycolicibacterium iranicum]|uniref:Glucose-6-phosphate 1-dehydrogenase n=1 Tax=Mycolicibacterium iranicum TaxID=912594 RepID=A0A1X1WD90_MYCIR|nr:glucose-6-phosphate dehydrogenase [Mycolicibacterium iranicum]MCZ0727222.1 glucose-6-phosphate dehydrogenase [Mycolicibacterium iranicum]ORV84549.1 glucose-6-phosphate dehydrogenase [Mycolicibacterium iranicum]